MSEAPALTIEKNRLVNTIHGSFLGIIGDQSHTWGYHCIWPPAGDYSLRTGPGGYACAIDIGMDWPASRAWLRWLITEMAANRITNIYEVIGSYNGRDVRYWSDDSGWQTNGVAYQGEGHDTWTHVGIYRSDPHTDRGLLKGWTATGHNGGDDTMTQAIVQDIQARVTEMQTCNVVPRNALTWWIRQILMGSKDSLTGHGAGYGLYNVKDDLAAVKSMLTNLQPQNSLSADTLRQIIREELANQGKAA